MPAKRKGPRPFKREGLHRLECPACPNYVYATVAALEGHGLPVCPCGETFQPGRVELAAVLGVDDCPAMREYAAALEGAWHGQAGPALALRNTGKTFRDPSAIALERVERERRERARRNRLQAIAPAAEPMPF